MDRDIARTIYLYLIDCYIINAMLALEAAPTGYRVGDKMSLLKAAVGGQYEGMMFAQIKAANKLALLADVTSGKPIQSNLVNIYYGGITIVRKPDAH